VVAARTQLRGRVGAVQAWLVRYADRPLGRLGLLWFRRYMESTSNSGSALTLYTFLSVGPLLLAATGLFHAAGSDTNAFAQRLIEHQHLHGETARLVRESFGTVAHNALAASAAAVIGFLLWGIGIGQVYQDFYASAWRVQVRTLSDQARFTIWFFVVSGLLGLFIVSADRVRHAGLAAVLALWLVVSTLFWLWTPHYLLHRTFGLRALLPGALLASILIGGATAASPLSLGPSLNSDGRHFGSFGVVLAIAAWAYTLAVLSLICAVFSPVWTEWRESEKQRSETRRSPLTGL
jgi:uncharacterized BrkB/YihY/UPF0761 family membrane protein